MSSGFRSNTSPGLIPVSNIQMKRFPSSASARSKIPPYFFERYRSNDVGIFREEFDVGDFIQPIRSLTPVEEGSEAGKIAVCSSLGAFPHAFILESLNLRSRDVSESKRSKMS